MNKLQAETKINIINLESQGSIHSNKCGGHTFHTPRLHKAKFNPLTPKSDEHAVSPTNIHTLHSILITRILKPIK